MLNVEKSKDMTLIMPVGEESLSCVSDGDDADSGCLARSPDDILKSDFADGCYLNKIEMVKCSDQLKECVNNLISETSESLSSPFEKNEPICLDLSRKQFESSSENVEHTEPLVIYESKITVNSISKFSPPQSPNRKFSDVNNPSVNPSQVQKSPNSPSPSQEEIQENGDNTFKINEAKDTINVASRVNTNKFESHDVSNNKHSETSKINQNNISKFLNNSIVSSEVRKVRLRKLLQRRSVSESSTSDYEANCQNNRREKYRHSFSSYENCDKLQMVLDSNFINNKDVIFEHENIKNNINKYLNCDKIKEINNTNNIVPIPAFENKSRINYLEISDTLINNVKKSMIKEYQKLKKNSSLAYQPPDVNCFSELNHKNINYDREAYSQTNNEAVENLIVKKKEIQDQMCISKNECNMIPPKPETRVRTISNHETATCIPIMVENGSDFHRSHSFPVTISLAKNTENNSNISRESSPPTRLEAWKSILAEKKNSIKNHVKGICKNSENTEKEIVDICDDKSTAKIVEQDSFLNLSNDINDNRITGKKCDFSSSSNCREEQLINSSHIKVSFGHLESQTDCLENTAYKEELSNNTHVLDPNVMYTDSLDSFTSGADEKKSRRKSKLEEACHDIVHALDSIPGPQISQNVKVDCSEEVIESQTIVKESTPSILVKNNSAVNFKVDKCNDSNCANSNIASIITTIQPPKYLDIINEKSQQCPTPECCSDDESVIKNKLEDNRSSSSGNESDYCQTDTCGDECDYCSGDEAEDEEDDACEACCRNYTLTPVCNKHTRVITNGSLKSLRVQPLFDERGNHRLHNSRSLSLQAVLRRRHVNHHELAAIREYSVASDDQQDSEGDLSHDDSMCDLSSSWRFGLCEDQQLGSGSSTLKNDCKNKTSSPYESKEFAKLKSNSLPSTSKTQSEINIQKRPESAVLKHSFNGEDDATSFNFFSGGIHLPPRPPRLKRNRHPLLSISLPINPTSIPSPQAISPRPAMGLQGLQQRPAFHKLSYSLNIPCGPKTLVPRSPVNPNPPYGFPPPSPPGGSPGSPFQGRKSPLELTPPSPRTNIRSGALVTRNFSISDDEGGQRLSRRQVTITRHESAYREAADKGYLLTQSSTIDPYWLNWKLGVLLKTVEEVGSRLGESEKVVGTWGPFPQDQNLADQYVHNIRKFREILPDLQRGVDDVNDQAARFSAHNVPLSPANAAALHDINSRWKNLETTVNDRWRQIAGRSREVTPLTPAQLASSVSPPWERATATNKVPYYINHAQETTHWDHPLMMDLLDSLSEFNHIKFSAYRTATKLRSLQKKLSLDRAKLQMVTDVFDEHGLRGQNDRLIDVNDMIVVLSTLYGRISSDHSDVNTTLATDLCLNWLLNVYDSQRTGQMRVLSFRVGLICMCRGHLEEKYRYMFRLIADPNRLVDQRKLGLLLHDCVQVPRQLGEVAAFGGSNIEPSVRSCFTKAGKDRETIEAVHFLTWVQQEPQSLVWLAVLHRVAASESIQHQVKCNICKTYPIVGLRYRCLKCLSFDMCQRCFFEGRSSKSHKITHPMHEYCTATTAGDEMKDFTKALKNKFKSKRSLQKHTKKGYLPVQTVLEGDPLESPSPSPSHNVTSQDMHSRLELYASRLAEVELRTNSNSTPDSEDEHGLIAQYCQSLSSTDAPFPVPKSPLQIMASVDADQKDELEQMIKDLEEENRALQAEYERLKSEQPTSSILEDGMGQRSEAEMLAEAKLLREHKGRLEARMSILEDHNRQLEAQLHRLRQLLVEQQSGMGSPNKSSTLQTKSVTASQLAMDSPAKINGHSNQGGPGSAYEGLDQMSEYVRPPPPPVGSIAHMGGNLFSRQGGPEKPVGSPAAIMNRGRENDSHSDDHSDENDYDNTVSPIQTKAD